jgi:hypothetical protein
VGCSDAPAAAAPALVLQAAPSVDSYGLCDGRLARISPRDCVNLEPQHIIPERLQVVRQGCGRILLAVGQKLVVAH